MQVNDRQRNVQTRSRRAGLAAAAALTALLCMVFVSSASAANERQFKEDFGSAEQPSLSGAAALAVDQGSGDLLVVEASAGAVSRWNPDGTPDPFSALSGNVIDGKEGADETLQEGLSFGAPNEIQIAVDSSGGATDGNIYVTQVSLHLIDIFGPDGTYLGQLTAAGSEPLGETCGVGVDKNGVVYVGDYSAGIRRYVPSGASPTNTDYASTISASGTCTVTPGTDATAGAVFAGAYTGPVSKYDIATGTKEFQVSQGSSVTEAVNPVNGNVLVAAGEEVIEFDASGSSEATEVAIADAESDVRGITVGPNGDLYVARAGSAQVAVFGRAATPPAIEPVTGITATTAILHGTVFSEEEPITACSFEYSLRYDSGFQHSAPCTPSAASIPPDSSTGVTAALSGLESGATYKVRLTISTAATSVSSGTITFTTNGPPTVSEVRALDANQTSATLEAKINPKGFGTSYKFEWGTTDSYGHQVPVEFDPVIGAGSEPVKVSAKLTGLSPDFLYHYRVVATNSAGSVSSEDHTVETLNSCGLPQDRCFELVSRGDPGPVAQPGNPTAVAEYHFQASKQPGGVAYAVESGYPDSTKGAEVLYGATRGDSGWTSSQISPPGDRGIIQGNASQPGYTLGLGQTLSCAILESYLPLTDDPGVKQAQEEGRAALFLRRPGDSFTAITKYTPVSRESQFGSEFVLDDFTPNCDKIVFSSAFSYPGISGAGESRLYEWEDGTLRNVGVVPGPSGDVVVEATAGTDTDHVNVVSADGGRVFFSAERQTSDNPAEIGKTAIFVREDGTTTRDLSLSETGVASGNATFQYASDDGSRVFFTANAGLTDESNASGTDLYQYDLETSSLTDLSVGDSPGVADVYGFTGASADGSQVYFVARGQLEAGHGPTLAQNAEAGTYSLYGASEGEIDFIGTVTEENALRGTTIQRQKEATMNVSPDGRYLLFESSADVTGYPSDRQPMVYLYDAGGGEEPTVCISCRQDGKPTVRQSGGLILQQLPTVAQANNTNGPAEPNPLVVRNGEPVVFFRSEDGLAPGGIDGTGGSTLYEWAHGQVFAIAADIPGTFEANQAGTITATRFYGASAEGTDLFVATPKKLTWEDGDDRSSVYSARIGGGFPEPPPPAAPCDSTSEGSCQGPAGAAAPAPAVGSATYAGPGNPPPAKHKRHKKNKRHKKHHRKCKHTKKHRKCSGKNGSKKRQGKRNANSNRRAGK